MINSIYDFLIIFIGNFSQEIVYRKSFGSKTTIKSQIIENLVKYYLTKMSFSKSGTQNH